jgi:predicted nuclease of predicted toxin-antitoxin system
MRFLADECVDAGLIARLRDSGHDVQSVAEDCRGTSDQGVLDLAIESGRILVTEDKDFGEFAFRRRQAVPGIVLLRIRPVRRDLKWPRLRTAIDRFGSDLAGRYTVIEESRYRGRPLLRQRP